MNKQLLENPLLLVIDMQNVYSNGQKWECFWQVETPSSSSVS